MWLWVFWSAARAFSAACRQVLGGFGGACVGGGLGGWIHELFGLPRDAQLRRAYEYFNLRRGCTTDELKQVRACVRSLHVL